MPCIDYRVWWGGDSNPKSRFEMFARCLVLEACMKAPQPENVTSSMLTNPAPPTSFHGQDKGGTTCFTTFSQHGPPRQPPTHLINSRTADWQRFTTAPPAPPPRRIAFSTPLPQHFRVLPPSQRTSFAFSCRDSHSHSHPRYLHDHIIACDYVLYIHLRFFFLPTNLLPPSLEKNKNKAPPQSRAVVHT